MTMMLLGYPGQVPPQISPVLIVPFLIFSVFLAYCSMYPAAYITGWRKLAERFGYDSIFAGTIWRWQSIGMRGGSHYNNCTTVGASEEGLYLALPWFFSAGHQPLLIPWNELYMVERKKILWMEFVCYKAGLQEQIPLRLMASLVNKIEQAKAQNYPA